VQVAFGQAASPPAEADKPEAAQASDWMTRKTLTGDWGGVRSDLEDMGIKLSLSYQHQLQANFRGGLDTHNAHRNTGSYDAVIKLDFEKMHLIDNAGFYFKAKGNWSESSTIGINNDKVGASGAARVNSDVGPDDEIYMGKWWYWQKFMDDRIELRLGRLETNKDLFDVSLYANHEDKDFLNRLSIRNATIPHRTGLGAFLKVEPIDHWYFQMAAIDAQSTIKSCEQDFETAFHDEAWFIGLWEFGFTPEWESSKGPMPGRYRAGLWYDPRAETIFEDDIGGRRIPDREGDDVGFYLSLDQMIWKELDDPGDSQGLGFFCRYGFSHEDVNRIEHYWQGGLSYKGLIPERDKDILGFSVAQAILSGQYRRELNAAADAETVYELYYKYYLTPWFVISPDFQVITNPGGEKDDRDSIVGGVRFRVIF
jgi:porin